MSLSLETAWSDQTLDLRSLESLRFAFLWGQRSLDDVLSNIILLLEVVKLANLSDSLGAQSSWDGVISETRDVLLTLADDDQV